MQCNEYDGTRYSSQCARGGNLHACMTTTSTTSECSLEPTDRPTCAMRDANRTKWGDRHTERKEGGVQTRGVKEKGETEVCRWVQSSISDPIIVVLVFSL